MSFWPNYGFTAYKIAEREALIQVINAVCGSCSWMETTQYIPTTNWEHALTTPNCTDHMLMVAHHDQQIIGWCRVFPLSSQPRIGELGIGLLTSYHRQGIGTHLVQQAQHWAEAASLTNLSLTTHAANKPAQRLFLNTGFTFADSKSVAYPYRQMIGALA
jgi:RimJ/RimL family protein N-acetyltransferase